MNSIIRQVITSKNKFVDLVKSAGGQMYLDARWHNKIGLPSNSTISTWTDLTGNGNHGTATNFAGTVTGGVVVSDPLKPYWYLDATNPPYDYFSITNSTLNITTAPIAVFSTLMCRTSSQSGYIFCINDDATTNIQYGIRWDTSIKPTAYLEGSAKGQGLALTRDTWQNVGFIWDGTTVKYYINFINGGTNGSYSSTLTSRTNCTVGRRATETEYLKGNLATVTVYSGSMATATNILRAEREISKSYLGLG